MSGMVTKEISITEKYAFILNTTTMKHWYSTCSLSFSLSWRNMHSVYICGKNATYAKIYFFLFKNYMDYISSSRFWKWEVAQFDFHACIWISKTWFTLVKKANIGYQHPASSLSPFLLPSPSSLSSSMNFILPSLSRATSLPVPHERSLLLQWTGL